MREQNIRHIASNERSQIGKHLQALAAGAALALIVNAKKIKVPAAKRKLRVFMAKQLHAGLRKEVFRSIFGPGVNFVVSVATENAERRVELPNFIDAIGQRIGCARDEVSGNHRKIGAQLVSHSYGAANIRAAHIATEMNIA